MFNEREQSVVGSELFGDPVRRLTFDSIDSVNWFITGITRGIHWQTPQHDEMFLSRRIQFTSSTRLKYIFDPADAAWTQRRSQIATESMLGQRDWLLKASGVGLCLAYLKSSCLEMALLVRGSMAYTCRSDLVYSSSSYPSPNRRGPIDSTITLAPGIWSCT